MRRAAVVLCCLLAAELASLAAPAHAQREAAQFTAEPARGSSLAATGDYFLLRSSQGESVKQALVIRNDSKRPIGIRLAAVDATSGPYGGVSYGLPTETPARVGKWISLERGSLTLPPSAATRVSFTVSVPADVTSGEHLGGLAIWSPATDPKQEAGRGAGQAGASVTVQSRRVIAVLVRFPGPAEPRLAVTGVTPTARADSAYLEVGIENRGFGLTKASGIISLPEENFRHRFEVDSFVPGTSIAYPIKWMERPREGEYRARVELEYTSRKTSWEGTFSVGEEVTEELVDRGGPAPGGSGTVEESGRSDGMLLAAGAAAAAAAVVSVLAGAIWLVSRRRSRRRARRAPDPLHDSSRGDSGRSEQAAVSAPLLTPVAVERWPRNNRGTAPAGPAATAEPGLRSPAPRAQARADRSAARLEDPEKEAAHAAAAVGAAAVVGGALWLLMRARSRERS